MSDLVQTKSVADIIVQAVPSSTGFIVQTAEVVDKLVDKAVYECRL